MTCTVFTQQFSLLISASLSGLYRKDVRMRTAGSENHFLGPVGICMDYGVRRGKLGALDLFLILCSSVALLSQRRPSWHTACLATVAPSLS